MLITCIFICSQIYPQFVHMHTQLFHTCTHTDAHTYTRIKSHVSTSHFKQAYLRKLYTCTHNYFIYAHTQMCIHAHTHTHVHSRAISNKAISQKLYTCTHNYFIHAHTCTHTHSHIHTHACMHSLFHTLTLMNFIHTRTHVHTQTRYVT